MLRPAARAAPLEHQAPVACRPPTESPGRALTNRAALRISGRRKRGAVHAM